jgi:hypothetical protein
MSPPWTITVSRAGSATSSSLLQVLTDSKGEAYGAKEAKSVNEEHAIHPFGSMRHYDAKLGRLSIRRAKDHEPAFSNYRRRALSPP